MVRISANGDIIPDDPAPSQRSRPTNSSSSFSDSQNQNQNQRQVGSLLKELEFLLDIEISVFNLVFVLTMQRPKKKDGNE